MAGARQKLYSTELLEFQAGVAAELGSARGASGCLREPAECLPLRDLAAGRLVQGLLHSEQEQLGTAIRICMASVRRQQDGRSRWLRDVLQLYRIGAWNARDDV